MAVTRSVEKTIEHGRQVKEPKTARARRTIAIATDLFERLLGYGDRMKRLVAGVPYLSEGMA